MARLSMSNLPMLWHKGLPYGVKFANIGISVLVTLLLARTGGPEVLGSYAIAIQTAQLVSLLAVGGCDQLILRELAGHMRMGDHAAAMGHLRQLLRHMMMAALLAAIIYPLAVWGAGLGGLTLARDPALLAAAGFVVANALYVTGLGTIRGLGKALMGQIYEGIYLLPMAVWLLVLLIGGRQVGAADAVVVATMLLLASMAILAVQVRRETSGWPVDRAIAPINVWRAGSPIMAAQLLFQASQWLPLFLSGLLGSAADAGTFRAAWQLAFPLLVVQATTLNVTTAEFSGDLREGRFDVAQARLRRGRLTSLAIGLPLALPILIWPEALITLLFGPGFEASAAVVRILVMTNLATLASGPAAAVITVAGRNSATLPITLASLVLQVVLAMVLTPYMGAALALTVSYAISVAVRLAQNIWLADNILRKLSAAG
jgi:O-antigen/teichoic acid export membrane protein